MDTQFGAQILPLAAIKLKIVEFIELLVKLKNDIISQRIDELGLPALLLKTMKQYYMNSCLHCKVFTIFNEAINSSIDYLIDSVFLIINL